MNRYGEAQASFFFVTGSVFFLRLVFSIPPFLIEMSYFLGFFEFYYLVYYPHKIRNFQDEHAVKLWQPMVEQ